MADEDILNKALDILDENEEKGLPNDADGVITEVEVTTREEVFGAGSQWGEDDDPMVQISFDVVYSGAVIDSGRVTYPVLTTRTSKLAKFNRRYGRPEVGLEVEVFLPKDSDYWDIDIAKKEED